MELRNCVSCNTDITRYHHRTIRCRPCAQAHKVEYKNIVRNCISCNQDITGHHNRAVRCRPCAEIHKVQYQKGYNKSRIKKPEIRCCSDCLVDISDLHCQSVRCNACSKLRKLEYQKNYRIDKRNESKEENVSRHSELIIALRRDGMSIKNISQKIKISVDNVCKILNQSTGIFIICLTYFTFSVF